MPQVGLEIGQYGTIGSRYFPADKKARAWTTYRDTDGVSRPVDAWDVTEPKARAKLRRKLNARQAPARASKEGRLTSETRFSVALDKYIAELELDETMAQQTIDGYRRQIEKSDDKRADPEAIKIRPSLGHYRIRELDTPVLDAYLTSIAMRGQKRKARWHKTIIGETLDLCKRHGAIKGDNPVNGVNKRAMRRRRAKPKAQAWERLQALRAQVERWGRGEEIPGTPAYTFGPRRNAQELLDVMDMAAGSGGVRPHEVFAFLWEEVEGLDFDTGQWRLDKEYQDGPEVRLTISGTVVPIKGQGWVRQSWLKVGDDKAYTVLLPWFAVKVLHRRWDEAGRPSEGLIFTARNGRVKSPNNFNRSWRSARGTDFADVTLGAYRKTVATATADAKGIDAAGRQLNHTAGSRVTAQHYVDRASEVPDNRDVLNAYFSATPGGAAEKLA
ncbi:hypothetical protein K7711_16835 [Nocardia sp. CA2R105]|uniref:hypothetical protein n=1 Tax=Nocardia coffeae TaxID=2873381 RepID=UPI001CA67D22|nr:hypothetical protein [Nocardia coffeae]MBY8858151.1 hypothetical protein [Nocardia coffeae]